MRNYYVYSKGKFQKMNPKSLAKKIDLPENIKISEYSNEGNYENIWSARLSSGLFGLTNCKAGNRGPKNYNEVILGEGIEGLNKIVDLGFITCPVCKPEKINGFWDSIKDNVKEKYRINILEDYTDKEVLPFDARRVKWEEILPVTGKTPERLYVPSNLSDKELKNLNKRFEKIGFELPSVGYYNKEAPGRFTEYKIPLD